MASNVTLRGLHDMGAHQYWDAGPNMGALEDVTAFSSSVTLTIVGAYTASLIVVPAYIAKLGVINVST